MLAVGLAHRSSKRCPDAIDVEHSTAMDLGQTWPSRTQTLAAPSLPWKHEESGHFARDVGDTEVSTRMLQGSTCGSLNWMKSDSDQKHLDFLCIITPRKSLLIHHMHQICLPC